MKKLLALLILSGLILSSCAIGRGGDIEQLDPFGTGGDTPTDTIEPIGDDGADVSDTTDTPVSDTVDTTSPEPDTAEPADTDEPDENIFFANEAFSVSVTEDGDYLYQHTATGSSRVYEDAFLIGERVLLVSTNGDMSYICSVEDDGRIEGGINASSFTKYGEFVWADGKLYGADLIEVFSLDTPYYCGYNLTTKIEDIRYDEENTVLHITLTANSITLEYSLYLGLTADAVLPEGAALLDEYDGGGYANSGLLYYAEDGYYQTYDYLTLKLPIDGDFKDFDMINPSLARFIKSVDSEIYIVETSYHFKRASHDQAFVGLSTVSARLDEVVENIDVNCKAEYNGATVVVLEPNTYVFKDGDVILKNDNFMVEIYTVGNLLVIGDSYYDFPEVILKPDLTPFLDEKFERMAELDDGNMFFAFENGRAAVLDMNGERVYEFDEKLNVLDIGVTRLSNADGSAALIGEWMLALAEDGTLRLYTPYGEELCNFGEIFDDYYYHWMLTGYYSKEGYPTGLYFIFEDRNDQNPDKTYQHHSYEYYYSFETGEHGMIDLGYSEFAYAKPVLYLYPTEATDVTVTFEHPERLTVDYPKYTDGWRVTAMPDGTLTGENGREYYALYWEEDSESAYYAFPDGFCVSGEDSATFLEEKLAALGFTDKEANEFIIYWLPILEANEYNLIRFELTEEREASNALHISPAPDSLLRVAMHVKAVDAPVTIREQRLPSFERVGFVAVEWGGCIH